jgi:hypothetical protein
MPATYTLINSNVLASSAASITFSSIPATYTDLVLRVSGRTDRAAPFDSLVLTINGTGGTAYSRTALRGNGSSAVSFNASSGASFLTDLMGITASTATSNTFGSFEIYIPSYTVSQNKPFSFAGAGEDNNSTPVYSGATAGLWSNTAAITQLSFAPNSGTVFVSGSSFYLYGISNA